MRQMYINAQSEWLNQLSVSNTCFVHTMNTYQYVLPDVWALIARTTPPPRKITAPKITTLLDAEQWKV